MKFLLFIIVLIALPAPILSEEAPSGTPALPHAPSEEDYRKYDEIAKRLHSQMEDGVGSVQAANMVLMMVQIMPKKERIELVMETAKKVQVMTAQQRYQAMETVVGVLRGIRTEEQKINLSTQLHQALASMTDIERQIIGIQLNKMLPDLKGIPVEDREILSPVMNQIISSTLSRN